MTRRHAIVLLLLLATVPTGTAGATDCGGDGTVAVLVSPATPAVGAPVRILVASDTGPIGDVVVADEAGTAVASPLARRGGPPWSGVVTIAALAAGSHRVEVRRDGRLVGCETVRVGARRPALTAWDRDAEALYSAWIERLFDAPPDQSLSFDSLQEVLRDPERNLLHDDLGRDEDDDPSALGAPPDCADLPYALRAYFASKTGLPIGYRQCGRGSADRPPTCGPVRTASPRDGGDARGWYGRTVRVVMDTVHSGSARTALADDATDFYPVALTREALRPGTIYADPYGHTLMIVQWVPQTPTRGGMLLAVDAQPDNSVARKRFWEGTFLFADDVAGAGPGFKAFRPLVPNGKSGVAPLANAALVGDPRFAPSSLEQARLAPEAFYARLARLINPDGLRPEQAHRETLDALVEQLETRVDSVQRGEEWVRAHPGDPMAMPDGARIFETEGPWEDYATPSRDLRLLIAIQVLLALPDRIVRHPELFVLDGVPPIAASAAVEQDHARAVAERAITYVRSDGSPWRLTIADILARRSALEMAYDPNDCIEIRWGAAAGSTEAATCNRHAPPEQRRRMAEYRAWFHEGRRPSR